MKSGKTCDKWRNQRNSPENYEIIMLVLSVNVKNTGKTCKFVKVSIGFEK